MTIGSAPSRDVITGNRVPDPTSSLWQTWFNLVKRKINDLYYKSACHVNKNGTSQNINANTETLLTWAVADYDTQGEVDLDNEKWTAAKDGLYLVSIQVSFAVAASNDRLYLYVYENTTNTIVVRNSGVSGDATLLSTFQTQLEKDDYLQFKVKNVDNNDTIRGSNSQTFFTVYRLGD